MQGAHSTADQPPQSESSTRPPAGTTAGAVSTAVAGIVAALSALGAGEFIAAFGAPSPGPVVAVANRVIDGAPTWFVEFGKTVFGQADKPALIVGTTVLSALFAIGLAFAARRSMIPAALGFTAFGVLGALAIGFDAQGTWTWALVSAVVAVLTGVSVLNFLLNRAKPERSVSATPPFGSPTYPPVTRRSFLGWAGAAGVAAAAAGSASQAIRSRSSVEVARQAVDLTPITDQDKLDEVVRAAASGEVGSTPGVSTLLSPNDDFYLIDTALIKPQVDPDTWSLSVTGMVDNELTFTYQDLLDRAETIAPVTLSCVSNEVGGGLVGNAIWQGVPLVDILDEAGVQPEATQIASRSVDGWTCGFPTEAAYDGRTALVAVAMNGEPLPVAHGFPARLVVAGLYGYVSATKWLESIEATTWEAFDGYWIPRGWSKLGPIKTQSRIDTPSDGRPVEAGAVPIAGVAWAPDTGITKVEVQVDEGDWMPARLGESLGADSWIQWMVPWEAEAGDHTIRVRATDASGYTQTSDLAEPAPSGATGWHTIEVTVV